MSFSARRKYGADGTLESITCLWSKLPSGFYEPLGLRLVVEVRL